MFCFRFFSGIRSQVINKFCQGTDRQKPHALRGIDSPHIATRQDTGSKAHFGRFLHTQLCHGNGTDLSAQSDFPEYDHMIVNRCIAEAGENCHHDSKVQGRFCLPYASRQIDICVIFGRADPESLLHDSEQEADPVDVRACRLG